MPGKLCSVTKENGLATGVEPFYDLRFPRRQEEGLLSAMGNEKRGLSGLFPSPRRNMRHGYVNLTRNGSKVAKVPTMGLWTILESKTDDAGKEKCLA